MKNILTILILFIFCQTNGQNLIQNGSFENYVGSCNSSSPNGDFHNNVIGWYSSGPDLTYGYSTIDLYCGQSNYLGCQPGPNLIGSSGSVYAGLHTRTLSPPYNEAIYQVLNTPLIQGNTYHLSLDLMTCQSGFFSGSDDFHVYANMDSIFPLCPTSSPSVQLLGTISNNTVSTTQWQTHAFSFIAPPNCNVIIFSGTCSATNTYFYIDNIVLTTPCFPSLDFGNDTTLCQGETLTLNATSADATYLWQDNSTNPTFNVTQQGIYWVELTNSCVTITDTINVNYNPIPDVVLGNDTFLCQNETLTLDATTANATYLWQDNSTNPTLNVTQQGIYWVKVTVNNCSATATIVIQTEGCKVILEMPNVFTPNNDGINDFFIPIISKEIVSMNTIIYNKWGNKIYETNKLLINWNGQDVSDGTYFWIVNYTDINGVENKLKGYVIIFK